MRFIRLLEHDFRRSGGTDYMYIAPTPAPGVAIMEQFYRQEIYQEPESNGNGIEIE